MTNRETISGARKNEAIHGQDLVQFLGKQVFIVDPRGQGFGLKKYQFLDAYANKFFILSGSKGRFISPKRLSPELVARYRDLDLDIPDAHNILAYESNTHNESLIARMQNNAGMTSPSKTERGIVPYMMTAEVERFARRNGFRVHIDAATVNHLADKAGFQQELRTLSQDIKKETGYDVSIPSDTFTAGNRTSAKHIYTAMSRDGKKDVVVVKPKSASALGIFKLRAGRGLTGLSKILDTHFADDEEVLLEEFVDHNHAPSMQGVRLPHGRYNHLYLGRQLITPEGDSVTYSGSQIPFGPQTVAINPKDVEKMKAIHHMVGQKLIEDKGISAIAGFDALASIGRNRAIQTMKLTELNLHLPSSLAVYGALIKMFPEGFDGIAHNMNIPLRPGRTPDDFMRENAKLFCKKQQQYGLFPLNTSYEDKVDVIIFAKDKKHVEKIRGDIHI